MDVDRVSKGKGKHEKGAGKGKDRKGKVDWQHERQQNPKGKPGGKGRDGGKKGKGGNQHPNQAKAGQQKETRSCHICKKPGHLAKDCWQAKGGKGRGKHVNQAADTASAQHDTVSSGASNVGASSSVSGAVRQVQVFELGGEPCDVASWFAGGHVRAVTCADASLKPRTIQCPTGVETLASPSVACVDVECLSSPGFECVAALSIVLSKLEARDDPVPTGGPFCDVCSVSECHHNDLCCIVECPWQGLKGESQSPSSLALVLVPSIRTCPNTEGLRHSTCLRVMQRAYGVTVLMFTT